MIQRILASRSWKLALLSGCLTGLSYPPLKLGLLAWVALVPLLKAMSRSRPGEAARLCFLSGVVANSIALYWLSFNSGAQFLVVFSTLVGSVLYLSVFWALLGYCFCWFHSRTGKGFVVLPLLWVTMEYLISLGLLGFPWISLATTQAEFLPVIQLAEFTGIYGISFWLLLLNVLIYRYLENPLPARQRLMNWAGLILVTLWLLGYARMAILADNAGDESLLSVALVQSNVGPHEKWDSQRRDWVFDHLDSMFVQAARDNPDLIVWPESAVPAYLRQSWRLKRILRRIDQTQVPLLTGTLDLNTEGEEREAYNGALLIQPDHSIATYHKIQLVPFAEYNPLPAQFPWAEELSLGQFEQGDTYTVFTVKEVPFSTVICFESAFPQIVRRFVANGAKFLAIVVNDGWFGNTSEPYQHAALARFRAVEHRMPVVRCANTGISAVYDSAGRMMARLGVDHEGIIFAGISPRRMLTFYTRFGDLFSQTCILLVFVLGVWFWYRQK